MRLDLVRVGDVELRGVDAIVTPSPCPMCCWVTASCARVNMSRNGDDGAAC